MRVATITTILAAAAVLAPTAAEAQPFYVGGGLGGAIRVDDIPTQFKLEQDFGYHFNRDGTGFYLGLSMAESFTNGFFIYTAGLRLGGDIPVVRGSVDFMLTPNGQLGVGVLSNGSTEAVFNFKVAFDLKLRFARNRVTLFLRPAAFDFYVGDGFGVRFDVIFGVYYNF